MEEERADQLAGLLLSVDAGAAMGAGAARRYSEITVTYVAASKRTIAERIAALRRRIGLTADEPTDTPR